MAIVRRRPPETISISVINRWTNQSCGHPKADQSESSVVPRQQIGVTHHTVVLNEGVCVQHTHTQTVNETVESESRPLAASFVVCVGVYEGRSSDWSTAAVASSALMGRKKMKKKKNEVIFLFFSFFKLNERRFDQKKRKVSIFAFGSNPIKRNDDPRDGPPFWFSFDSSAWPYSNNNSNNNNNNNNSNNSNNNSNNTKRERDLERASFVTQFRLVTKRIDEFIERTNELKKKNTSEQVQCPSRPQRCRLESTSFVDDESQKRERKKRRRRRRERRPMRTRGSLSPLGPATNET